MRQALYDIGRVQLTQHGIEDYFWPIAREEVDAVRDVFLTSLIPVLRADGPSDPHARLLACLIHILGEVLAAYQSQALIRRSWQSGREPVFPAGAALSHALMSDGIPDEARTVSLLRRGIQPDRAWRQMARAMRSRLRGEPLGQAVASRGKLRRNPVAIASGPLLIRHARTNGTANLLPLSTWFSPLPSSEAGVAGSPPPAFLDRFLDIVRSAFAAGNEPLSDATARYLRWWVDESLSLADRYLARMLGDPARVPQNLWRGTGGLVWGRLLSVAVKELGGTVTGHDHAHGQGLWASYSDTIIELPFCDQFVVHSGFHKRMAERNLRKDLCLPDGPPEFVAIPSTEASEMLPHPRATPGVVRSRPVAMYVGTIYAQDFVPFTPLLPGPTLVDWECRLINRLVAWGWDVVFKPHPENVFMPPIEIYGDDHVRLETGRFEQVFRQADVLLFAQQNSSSFFHALFTDMPIVLPTPPLNPWRPEIHPLVERRCAMVESRFGADNRIETDWDSLRTALEVAPNLRDPALRETFYAP